MVTDAFFCKLKKFTIFYVKRFAFFICSFEPICQDQAGNPGLLTGSIPKSRNISFVHHLRKGITSGLR